MKINEKYMPSRFIDNIKKDMSEKAANLINSKEFQELIMRNKYIKEEYDNKDQETPWYNKQFSKQLLGTWVRKVNPSCNIDEVEGKSWPEIIYSDGVDLISKDMEQGFHNIYGYNQKTMQHNDTNL